MKSEFVSSDWHALNNQTTALNTAAFKQFITNASTEIAKGLEGGKKKKAASKKAAPAKKPAAAPKKDKKPKKK
jgi:hypothetical protein